MNGFTPAATLPGRTDVAVIGGGILGLAIARELLERRPGLRVTVLERETELAAHQTGRNSGVLHAGLYYAPGSLKARYCRAGKAALEQYAAERGIPYERWTSPPESPPRSATPPPWGRPATRWPRREPRTWPACSDPVASSSPPFIGPRTASPRPSRPGPRSWETRCSPIDR